MKTLPELPVDLGTEAVQTPVGGWPATPIYQTQRGKKSGRDVPEPPTITAAEGFGRYSDM
jgi:hypothetical protein